MRAMTSLSVAPLCADQVLPVCRRSCRWRSIVSGMPAALSARFQTRAKLRRRGMPPSGPMKSRPDGLGSANAVRCASMSVRSAAGRLVVLVPASDFGSSST